MKIENFTFGKNWWNFINKHFDDEVLAKAKESLIDFTGLKKFKNLSFMDVGCGSGLFSLAASQLGAEKIVSFDRDANSIRSCRQLKKLSQLEKTDWQIKKGSVLNSDFIKKLGKYDLVYAWGVLHHTGKMWLAIENALTLVKPGGLMYLAIYNKTDIWGLFPDGRFGPSSFWKRFKKWYSDRPGIIQFLIDQTVSGGLIFLYLLLGRNPLKEIRSHPIKFRGMSWKTDIKDWLGGYPYEYASTEEIFKFVHSRGFSLENLKSNNGLMNNEYLFKRLK